MRNFLTNNIGIKLLSIIFAFILWLVVVNIDDPYITKTITGIPITIENEDSITDKDFVYTVTSGETATARIRGPRSILDNLNWTDFIATADFTELSITNSLYAIVELTEENDKYSNKIEFLRNSSVMSVELESIQTKEIDVTVNYTGTPKDGFMVGDQILTIPNVEVSAPESVLKTISKAVINVDINDKDTEFMTYEEPLLKTAEGLVVEYSDHIKSSHRLIGAKIIMHRIKEVPLEFQTVGTPLSGYEFIELDYEPEQISIHGLQIDLDSIEKLVISGTPINISGAQANVAVQIDISQFLPQGVLLYDENQKTINVTAVIQGPVSQNFVLEEADISLQNIPGGFSASITNDPIQVTLRGSATTLSNLTTVGLTGYVDLASAVAGSNEVPLKLNLPAGVSLVNEVEVIVELSQGE